MKKAFLFPIALGLAAHLSAATIFPGLMGKQLIDSLYARYRPTSTMGYDRARDTIYGEVDIVGDSLRCVYTGLWIHGGPTAAPRTWTNNNDFNCEHTWPQSQLPTQAVSDMQHMYPTENNVNNARSNYPFAELTDANTYAWYRYDAYNPPLYAPPAANAEEYSKYNHNTSFEPREDHKGHVARAMYYILTMYMQADTSADSTWWQSQKDTLYLWHCTHLTDPAESTRTYRIAAHQQGRINPFIMDSTLIRRCYYPSVPTNTQVSFAATAVSKNEGDGTFDLTVDITSPSASNPTTVQVAVAGGSGDTSDIGGYTTQTLTFPAGSSAPQTVPVTITDDTLREPSETIVFKLRNVSGGSSAAAGADSACTLTINDNDTPAGTLVSFSPAASTKTEGDAPFNITVAIANPDSAAATTADVVLAGGSGDASDINGYTTQTVTFPAGSAVAQNVQITITDDALAEGTETLVFKLRNVSGGTSAMAGVDSVFTLTINDNDATGTGGQVIGAFPGMDGGFELQQDSLAVVTTVSTAQTAWTVSASHGGIVNGGGRSGPKYAVFTQTGTSHKRLQSPTVATLAASTAYIVQFYYQGDLDGGTYGDIRGAVCQAGTSGPAYGSYVTGANTGAVWTKYTAALTTNTTAPTFGIGIVSVNNTAQFYVDDFVVYPGSAIDVTPPNAPAGVSVVPGKGSVLSLSWNAPSGGVDGGGYLVVRGTSDPVTAPNVNGIYSLGNPIGAGTVAYIGTAVSCSDTGLAPSTPYYYRVYAVDKAFNYSSAATGTGTTGVAGMPSAAPCGLGLGLDQNSPNPFSQATTIRYSLAKPAIVRIGIYNVLGQPVFSTQPRTEAAGAHSLAWSGRALPQGVYFYQLIVDNTIVATRRMTLIR